jgi:hypothetical protein
MATYHGGAQFGDAFVAKVDPSGSKLLFAGYIGGSKEDLGAGITVDGSGNVYVTGATYSDESTFPVSVGPFLNYHPGPFNEADAFVVKLTGVGPPQPDFSIGFDQPSITTSAGTKVTATVNIVRTGGFTGSVTVTPPSSLPRGIRIPGDPVTTSDNSVNYKIKVKGSADSGTDQLLFTATDDSGRVRNATLNLIVQ